jgi:hypothetical protein
MVHEAKTHYPLVLSLYNALGHNGHSIGCVVDGVGNQIPVISPDNKQERTRLFDLFAGSTF